MKKKTISLNGQVFNLDRCQKKLDSVLPDWERDVFSFLVEWFSESETVEIQTSGSTGVPKKISRSKSAMEKSAQLTGEFFGFQPGLEVLLCLPAKYIAGKMMLVRAIVWEMNLSYIEPKIHLHLPNHSYFFTAMTPPQAESNLNQLHRFSNTIIGGAAISSSLEQALVKVRSEVYETFGMSETVSHIALRKVGQTFFTTLPHITIGVNANECLIVEAPLISEEKLETNDRVELISNSQFIWKGRADYVINLGGVKIQPEEIEKMIAPLISSSFIIAGIPHEKWGEQVVLIIEGPQIDTKVLQSHLETVLSKREIPSKIYFLPTFEYTENGKIQRAKTVAKII